MSQPLLPLEILLEGAHLSDLAVATVADGEIALVPSQVAEHARQCQDCASRVRAAALQSVAVGDLLRTAANAEQERAPSAPADTRTAVIAAAAGAVMTVIGATLGAFGSSLSVSDRIRGLRELGVILARGLRAAFSAELPPALSFACAAFLVLSALVVMRLRPIARGRHSDRPVSS